ncbi:MAG TPA: hypothetical protein VD931_15420 [Baekduia sp.]|nr:hypothetical protein [Baekduia sp.]
MTPDPLDELRDRLRDTRQAAERLAGSVPPQGWATPQDADETQREAQALLALLQGLRDLVPPELQEQLREVVRQVLLLVRAVVDWWVERLEPGQAPGSPAEPAFEDIPVEP